MKHDIAQRRRPTRSISRAQTRTATALRRFETDVDDPRVRQKNMALFFAFGHRTIEVDFFQQFAIYAENMPHF